MESAADRGGTPRLASPLHPGTSALALRLRGQIAVQELMLTYVVMILNHHRLCRRQPHPHALPLNLIELGQSTQQIGAFQRRVRQTLAKVLLAELQRASFWSHWADWCLQVLDQWTETPPSICQTPGLLPLQDDQGVWSWREGVIIQAMALEAAHQLVESLPPEALEIESLEQLLGLQEALVTDSSPIDPRGFERIPLGLPLLAEAGGGVTSQFMPVDPTLGRLPLISVKVCPQSSQWVSARHVLGRWVWEMTQQFGAPVGYVGLSLVAQMTAGEVPCRDRFTIRGSQVLASQGERVSHEALQTLARRLALIAQSRVIWEERQLHQHLVHTWDGKLWILEALEQCQGLRLERQRYDLGAVEEVVAHIRPGRWADRWVEIFGEEAIQDLRGLGRVARQLFTFDPVTQGLTARSAMFLAFCAGQASPVLTVGELLEAVETEERVRTIVNSSMRREGFLQDWRVMWGQLHRLGWVHDQDPLEKIGMIPLGETDWLRWPLLVRYAAIGGTGSLAQGMTTSVPERDGAMEAGTPMAIRQISSESLERALALRGMSQAMLARSLKLDRSTINRWINGSRPINPRYRPVLWELLGSALQEG